MATNKRLIKSNDEGGGGNPTIGGNNISYTGDGNSNLSINTLGIQPDFLWIKNTSSNSDHFVMDSVSGGDTYMSTHTYDPAVSAPNAISSFDSNGFTLGTPYSGTNVAGSGFNAFGFAAGGPTPVENTNGTITSQVSVSVDGGFSIVDYTGVTPSGSFGHGLDAAPDLVIIKGKNAISSWIVYQTGYPSQYFSYMNTTGAWQDGGTGFFPSAPTSSVVNVGFQSATNYLNRQFKAYCWTAKAGISSFNTYTGNGGNQTISLGFEPKFLIIKCTTSGESYRNWIMLYKDGSSMKSLIANGTGAEIDQTGIITFNANDFNINCGGCGEFNQSGQTYSYMAFANQF